jgi:hypothetical protein
MDNWNCKECGFCGENKATIKTLIYKDGVLVEIQEELLCGKPNVKSKKQIHKEVI